MCCISCQKELGLWRWQKTYHTLAQCVAYGMVRHSICFYTTKKNSTYWAQITSKRNVLMTHQSQPIITFDIKYVFPFKTITSKWNTWSDSENATFWSFRKPYSPAGEEAWVSWSTWAESKQEKLGWHHMEVSCNRGTPKSSIWMGFPIKPSSYWGTLIHGNPYIFFRMNFLQTII